MEWTYAIHALIVGPSLLGIIELIWGLADLVIVYTCLRYGRAEFPPFLTRWMFLAWSALLLAVSFTVQLLRPCGRGRAPGRSRTGRPRRSSRAGRPNGSCGLITAADLTVQFGTRVRPFVLVEEIEQRLRRVVDQHIPLERLRATVPRHRASRVRSAANLTFGAYGHLLRVPENWAALGWGIDQEYFLTALEECRNFRNSLMHFSPDPITDEQLRPAQGLLELLRSVDPQM
ncbi:hypothetical protein ACFXDH_07760 [Streptomyces sp. NPDC059467]|uniref:hypothetical protein n=1 Tax=Streptomyces sp. NPDC059467 TaxID=3346844 RepID=UPI0036B6932C